VSFIEYTSAQQKRPDYVAQVRSLLIQIGQQHDGTFPWHRTSDPYVVFVAEYFLRATTRTVVARIHPRVIERYPTLEEMASANSRELLELTREAGLFRRTEALVDIAVRLRERGGVPDNEQDLLKLPHVGQYIAQSVLLYAFGIPRFPLDRGIHRVILRLFDGSEPHRTDPTRDPVLGSLVKALISNLTVAELRALHQGVLALAWSTCRGHAPKCQQCPLQHWCVR
jgi:A/G-specific adenine glycosylase